jgi:hypothetical protein
MIESRDKNSETKEKNMRKKLLLFLLFSAAISVQAQITLSGADFPHANDLYLMSDATAFQGMDASLTGANYSWDFSPLSTTTIGEHNDTIFDVSGMNLVYTLVFGDNIIAPHRSNQSRHGTDFNLAQITITDVYNFYYNTTNDYHQSGFGALVNGLPVPTPYTPHDFIYRYPVEFGNLDSSASGYEVSLPNFLYYAVNKNRINEVDGWGTLITPSGTYNALRLKSTIFEHDSVFLDTLGFGYGFNVPTQVEYKWLGQGEGDPLLQVNEVGGNVTSVVYKGSNILATPTVAKKNFDFAIFPNPVAEHLFVDFSMLKAGTAEIQVTGVSGNVVKSIVKQIDSAGEQRFMVDLPSGIEAGTYQVKLVAGNESAVRTFVLVK